MSRVKIQAVLHNDNRPDEKIELVGRVAWTAYQLVRAGPKGCTPVLNPVPRWSDYVFRLRGLNIVVETISEPHKGQFVGIHARYVLRSKLTLSGDAIQEWSGMPSITGGAPRPTPNTGGEIAA